MKFSYNWLQSFFKKKLPAPKKLADILTMRSFEVKELTKVGDDFALNIDVLPNRIPDCASHLGIAREIGTILSLKLHLPVYNLKEDKKNDINDILKIDVKDKNLCPRYLARVITDIKVSSSPKWLQNRLVTCGLQPINNIVDTTNYVMLETGEPLHAFDLGRLTKDSKKIGRIIVRLGKKGEKITTIDGKTFDLTREDLVIADSKDSVALAGIKGGKKAQVTNSTETIVLEAANFNQANIYRTSKRLKLQTDASLRFSSGLDPNLVEEGIQRVSAFIQKLTKGRVLKGKIDFYPKKIFPKKIKLDLNYLKSLLGTEISKEKVIKILKDLGFQIISPRTSLTASQLLIKVPTFRQDIIIPEDLIEEIGRIYGYTKIKENIPVLPIVIPKENRVLHWENKIKKIIQSLGFTEVYNYSFISEKDAKFFSKLAADKLRKPNLELLEIENPTSSNTKYLRPSLVVNLLKVIKNNQKRFSNINIFEIGKTFQLNLKRGDRKEAFEKRILGGVILGGNGFYELKGKIEALLKSLGLTNTYFDSYRAAPQKIIFPFWQEENIAEIKINGQEVGFLGQISNEVVNFYQIENSVYAFEIDFEKLLQFAVEEHEYESPSLYPEAIRDLAILVPQKTLAGEVIQKIHLIGGELIRDVEIFDIFEGPPLPEGKKNLAFHVIYQARDRTLSSKEVDKIQEKIINLLEENPSWEVRK